MASPVHLFLHQDMIYSSKNPEFPPFTVYSAEREFIPENVTSLCWALNAFPHIAFVPVSPRFHGPIFGRLASYHTECVYPQGAAPKWQLVDALQQSWYSLETGLRWMAAVLLEGQSTSLEFAPFPMPSSFGYLRPHKSKPIAAKCARHSRDAFVQLASLCSFAIALNCAYPEEANPNWVRTLHTKGFHPAWVENFRATQFGKFFSTERVGAVVHPQCGWLFQVPMMLRANVPLWFFWEDGSPDIYEKKIGGFTVRPFRPKAEDIAALRYSINFGQLSEPAPSMTHSPHPLLPEHSRQLPGETWQDYFRRQDECFHNTVGTENNQDRQARQNREREAARSIRPGRSGPLVFEWSESDSGVLVRTGVSRSEVPRTWQLYARNQRRFNSIHNEWDLCRELAPDDLCDSDDSEDEYFGPPSPPTLLQPPPSNNHWEHDLSIGYDNYRTPGLDVSGPNLPLEDVLCSRYGFFPSLGYSADPLVRYPVQDVKTVFGHRDAVIVTQANVPAILTFYDALLKGLTIPPSLCDLYEQHDDPLSNQIAASNTVVRVKVLSGDHYYVLEPRNPPPGDASWQVVVKDPVTAVQCYRENWASSRIGLAKVLLSRGIPFSTRAVLPLLTPAPVMYYFDGLGRRPESHKPDRFDYIEYEDRVAEFLRRPHARSALLKGGLVWRLVKEVMGSRGDENVLLGPSAYVGQFGNSLHLDAARPAVWDDTLSETELHFISGLYKVYTGSGNQIKDLSWWPKHETWEKSPLNVGYWSPNCEEWFQQRLEAIRSGSDRGQPQNASSWGKSLKRWGRTPKLVKTSRDAAAAFLDLHKL